VSQVYRVNYQTFAILQNGDHGNIAQTRGIVYTDVPFAEIETALNEKLLPTKRLCDILEIKALDGVIISKGAKK
jgi:hypothetical protein